MKHLGRICKRGHEDPENPGRTWRYTTNRSCVVCKKLQSAASQRTEKRKNYLAARRKTAEYKEQLAICRNSAKYKARRAARYRTDTRFALVECLRSRLYHAVKTQDATKLPADEYGIDWQAIVDHLGPCPGGRGEWHIDHIIPCCAFDHTDPEQVRACWSPENLRWLPALENSRKSAEDKKISRVSS